MINYLLDEIILMFIAIVVWFAVPGSEIINALVTLAVVYAGIVMWCKIKNKNKAM